MVKIINKIEKASTITLQFPAFPFQDNFSSPTKLFTRTDVSNWTATSSLNNSSLSTSLCYERVSTQDKVSIANEVAMTNQQSLFERTLNLENLAWKHGVYKRQPKKITVSSIVEGFMKMKNSSEHSLKNWAVGVGLSVDESISRQALNERLTTKLTQVLSDALRKILDQRLNWEDYLSPQQVQLLRPQLTFFNRVLVHDSTCQGVAANLADKLSGPNANGKKVATLRIQAVVDLLARHWIDFSIHPYSQNDAKQSKDILQIAKKGDLILRDLGYFVLDTLEQLIKDQYVITKYKYGTHLYKENGQRIDIPTLFKRKKRVDMSVLLGKKHQIPMRLVARKLPEKEYKKRLAAAKKDRNSRTNHSEKYYENLKYEVYLTNVPRHILSTKQVIKIYALRWSIEIFFKAWKSHFRFKDMLKPKKVKYDRLICTIYLLLIQIAWFHKFFLYVETAVFEQKKRWISVLKFFDLVAIMLKDLLAIHQLTDIDLFIPHFAQHATYEKGVKRKNMIEKILIFKEL